MLVAVAIVVWLIFAERENDPWKGRKRRNLYRTFLRIVHESER